MAELLSAHGVSKLWIGGCATDFCVDRPGRNAASLGYEMHVLSDANATLSAFSLSCEQVICYIDVGWKAGLYIVDAVIYRVRLVRTLRSRAVGNPNMKS